MPLSLLSNKECRFVVFLLLLLIVSALLHHHGQGQRATNAIHRHGPQQSPQGDRSLLSPMEQAYVEIPTAAGARRSLHYITSQPHVAGTPGDFYMAEYVQQEMQAAGIDNVEMYELTVLLNYPSQRPVVRLLTKSTYGSNDEEPTDVLFTAALQEDLLDDTSDTMWRNHTFHGYAPSGNVKAPLVFANYGRPADFAALERAGVNVQGCIVLIRYGQCFRGLKVRNAQQAGAVGVLIYSDPAQDGYNVGTTYPRGPWRPESGVQRGSVQFNSACAGDPMRADARYAARGQNLTTLCGIAHYQDWIPRIPSLPLSYGDARPLLESLAGTPTAVQVFGSDFDGGLHGLNYTVGPPQDTIVHLHVQNHESISTIPNVIGYIPGSLPAELDMPVLLGNHRDAWYVLTRVYRRVVDQYPCWSRQLIWRIF